MCDLCHIITNLVIQSQFNLGRQFKAGNEDNHHLHSLGLICSELLGTAIRLDALPFTRNSTLTAKFLESKAEEAVLVTR